MCEDEWKGGFLGTAFYFSMCVALLIVPRMADKYGRRWLYLSSRLAECALYLGTMVATNYWLVAVLISLLGVAAAGR